MTPQHAPDREREQDGHGLQLERVAEEQRLEDIAHDHVRCEGQHEGEYHREERHVRVEDHEGHRQEDSDHRADGRHEVEPEGERSWLGLGVGVGGRGRG